MDKILNNCLDDSTLENPLSIKREVLGLDSPTCSKLTTLTPSETSVDTVSIKNEYIEGSESNAVSSENDDTEEDDTVDPRRHDTQLPIRYTRKSGNYTDYSLEQVQKLIASVDEDVCGSFNSFTGLSKKDYEHEKGKFNCSICGKDFKSNQGVTTHQAKAHGIKKIYKCEICNKQSSCPSALKHHLWAHRRALAAEDNRKSGIPFTPTYHEKVRSKECSYCDQWYRLRYKLDVHVTEVHYAQPIPIIDTGAQPIRSVTGRKKHNTIQLQPATCPFCGTDFGRLKDCLAHIKEEHRSKEYETQRITCEKCSLTLLGVDSLKRHVRLCQGDQTVSSHDTEHIYNEVQPLNDSGVELTPAKRPRIVEPIKTGVEFVDTFSASILSGL